MRTSSTVWRRVRRRARSRGAMRNASAVRRIVSVGSSSHATKLATPRWVTSSTAARWSAASRSNQGCRSIAARHAEARSPAASSRRRSVAGATAGTRSVEVTAPGGTVDVPPGTVQRFRLRCRRCGWGALWCWSAERRDLGGLRTLLALLDVERHALALVEALVSVGLDRGVVHEHVRAATVGSEEAVALLAVEPLDGALCHSCSPRTWCRGTRPRHRAARPLRSAPGSGRHSQYAAGVGGERTVRERSCRGAMTSVFVL